MVTFACHTGRMCRFVQLRVVVVLAAAGCLWGCGVELATPGALAIGIGAATLPALGRTVPDVFVSVLRNQDCSLVRVEQGKSYCREPDPPPEPPMLCTRSLANVDCWSNPQALTGAVRAVADGPTKLTPAQEAYRTRGWFW